MPSNNYALYEENIGRLTPIIADVIEAAEKKYSPNMVSQAIRIAAKNNALTWKYIEGVLRNMPREEDSPTRLEDYPKWIVEAVKELTDMAEEANGEPVELTDVAAIIWKAYQNRKR